MASGGGAAAPQQAPAVSRFTRHYALARREQVCDFALACAASGAGVECAHGAECSRLRGLLAHAWQCTPATCAVEPRSHVSATASYLLFHAVRCSVPQGQPCSWPHCDATRPHMHALHTALATLPLELEGVTDPPSCPHAPHPYSRLRMYLLGPHEEVITYATRVRAPGHPRSAGVPLLDFLDGSVALPGLAEALKDADTGALAADAPIFERLLLRYGGRVPYGLFATEEMMALAMGAYVAEGEIRRAVPLLGMLINRVRVLVERSEESLGDEAHQLASADAFNALLQAFNAVAEVQSGLNKAGDLRRAAEHAVTVVNSGLLRYAREMHEELRERPVMITPICRTLQHLALALHRVGDYATGAGDFEALVMGWLVPNMQKVFGGTHQAEWMCDEEGFIQINLELQETIGLLAVSPRARASGIVGHVFSGAIRAVLGDGGGTCAMVRCETIALSGMLVRQLVRAPVTPETTPGWQLLLRLTRQLLMEGTPAARRMACVYIILPMARAERSRAARDAEASARAVCRQPCCAAAAAAPTVVRMLAAAGILPVLADVARTTPLARRAACAAIAAILGRDRAIAASVLEAAPELVAHLGAARDQARAAAAATARRSAAEARRLRAARLAAINARRVDEDGDKIEPHACYSAHEANGCESDCAAASEDDDDDGGSLPFAQAALESLAAATAGTAPPPLPPHTSAASTAAAARLADAAAAELLAEEAAEAAAKGGGAGKTAGAGASGASGAGSKKKKKKKKSKSAAAGAAGVPAEAAGSDDDGEGAGSEPEAEPEDDAVAPQPREAPAAAASGPHAAGQPACRDACCVPTAPFRLGARSRGGAPAAAAAAPSVPPPAASAEAEESSDALMAALFPHLALDAAGRTAVAAAEAHEETLCVICLDAPRDTALPACADRHLPVLCALCAAIVAAAAKPVCPWCRTPIAVDGA